MKARRAPRVRDLLAGAVLALGAAACTWQGIRPDASHTGHLYISGTATHVSDDEVAAIAAPYLKTSLFDVDVKALRHALARQPWLARVEVSRRWPDGVAVHVAEHAPVALWGSHGVLGADGAVFVPDAASRPQDLAQLDGPAGAGQRVYERYRQLSERLAGHHAQIASLALNARGSWTATLDNGLVLRLGRNHLGQRLQRYVDYALDDAEAQDALANAGYVDLRYSDGFAVGGSRAQRDTDQEKGNDQAA